MKRQITKCYVFSLLLIVAPFLKVDAQIESRPHFLGVNPSVTVEPFYEKGELDINILPVVYQTHLTNRIDIRLTTILNLGVRNSTNNLSHFGLESAFPFSFSKREHQTEYIKGFFIAPIISLARNRIEHHNNIGLWLEPGYNLLFDNKFAMSFGLQLGQTYFNYDSRKNEWGNHFGLKIIFGRWL